MTNKTLAERAAEIAKLAKLTYYQIIYCCSAYGRPFDNEADAKKTMDAKMVKHRESGFDMGGAYIHAYSELEEIAGESDCARTMMHEMTQLIADQQAYIKSQDEMLDSAHQTNQAMGKRMLEQQKWIEEMEALLIPKLQKEMPNSCHGNYESMIARLLRNAKVKP